MKFQHGLVVVLALGLTTACTNTALEEENASLKQLSDSYADKLAVAERMSEQDKSEIERLREDLQKALDDKEATVRKLDELTIIDIGQQVLFPSGNADLSMEGQEIAEKIASAFNNYPNFHMRIEGHTDSVPISENLKDKYFSNWELSAARAATMVRFLIYRLEVPEERVSIGMHTQLVTQCNHQHALVHKLRAPVVDDGIRQPDIIRIKYQVLGAVV